MFYAHTVCSTFTCAHAYCMLIGACNSMPCPTHGVQAALRLGRIDTSSTALADAIGTAESPAGTLWAGSPGPDPETAMLMRRAMAGWAPARHSLHHRGVRVAVRTTLLVAQRLRELKADAVCQVIGDARWALPVLPSELHVGSDLQLFPAQKLRCYPTRPRGSKPNRRA